MSESEKIAMVKALLSNDAKATTDLVSVLLKRAESAIILRAYPFGSGDEKMPTRYGNIQCQLAVRYFSRMGAEGETSHNENGINRQYANTNDDDLLCEIMQIVG